MPYETHYKRYSELNEKYRIEHSFEGVVPYEERKGKTVFELQRLANRYIQDYDVVVERCGSTYAGTKYRVIRNKPCLCAKDLAIICDGGNLCFGYRTEGGLIIVYTD